MRIFHSGLEIIREPDISKGRKNADFGPGFYLSLEKEFAFRWTKVRSGAKSYINVYDLNEESLMIKKLKRDEEWYDFIYSNRNRSIDLFGDYDVIIGPIANDTLYDVFGIPTSGLLSKEDSLDLLKLGGEYHQVVIKSEKALKQLKWTDAVEVDPDYAIKYHALTQKEGEEYRAAFGKLLEERT